MMKISDRAIGQFIGLITLVLGIAIGFYFGQEYHPIQIVQAQAVAPPIPNFTDVNPGMTTGSFGANLILAHEIATDDVVVNGIDLLKFDQNVINYLAAQPTTEKAELQNLVNASRATTIYRIKPPAAAPTPGVKQ
jgi:hypothetical protein